MRLYHRNPARHLLCALGLVKGQGRRADGASRTSPGRDSAEAAPDLAAVELLSGAYPLLWGAVVQPLPGAARA